MSQLTLEIPADLERVLENLAAEQKTSVEEVALERLRLSIAPPGSPRAIALAMRELPRLDRSWVDEMEEEIRKGRIPVCDAGVFD